MIRTVWRRDWLPQAPCQLAGGVSARGHHLQVHRRAAAAGVHALHHAGGLRGRRTARQRGDLRQHPRALRDDRVVPALLLHRLRSGASRRAGAARLRVPARRDDGRLGRARRARRPVVEGRARSSGHDDVPDRRAWAVDVHEPRVRLRPLARRRTPPRVRDGHGLQRPVHGPGDGHPRRRPRRRRPRTVARQLRRLDGRAPRALVDDAPSALGPARRAARGSPSCSASGCRRSPPRSRCTR